ncbi:Dyp-type peroxidase [Cellulosimicrobium arenosum]|uniref:Dyp-type peroxidase n=1 Tax=Cellulosimicrobium arenosum TaxID=2708133 RepID=A0A927J190_9MICO|nr:Dyp-type peroxidase [Cellulosimicrobium arenosum]MBD8079963.1 Dyp-type peroxidase [Cellulosimicrobium arenosum]
MTSAGQGTEDEDTGDAPGASRRQFLARSFVVGGVGLAGAAVGTVAGRETAPATGPGQARPDGGGPDEGTATARVAAQGTHQGGVVRPHAIQRHAEVVTLDVTDPTALADRLDVVGQTIADLADGTSRALAGLGPARLTVTVGVGPRVVAALLGADTPAATELPAFGRDDLTDATTGGDVVVLVRADDGVVVALARDAVVRALTAGGGVSERWSVHGFVVPRDESGDAPAPRNVVGFHDGLSIPRTAADVDAAVWLDGALAGATTFVVRKMPLDTAAFTALPVADQEAAVGRVRATGAPLSGGDATTEPNIHAKDDAGNLLIPRDAHVSRAHPLPAGLDTLMLRRSYSFSDGGEQGALFMSFQRDLDTFVRTQLRLDEADALTSLARTTASGAFLVLPGFTPDRPLGTVLRPS